MTATRFLPMLLSVALTLLTMPAHAQNAEMDAARAPLDAYIQAHATGNGDFIRKAFHADAKIVSVNKEGKYQSLTVEEFAKRFNGKPAADEAQRKRRIAQMEVTGNAGSGKIELEYPSVTFTDYMSLLKVDGEWKIVNKAFYGAPPK